MDNESDSGTGTGRQSGTSKGRSSSGGASSGQSSSGRASKSTNDSNRRSSKDPSSAKPDSNKTDKGPATYSAKDELWKEQIRQAVEESNKRTSLLAKDDPMSHYKRLKIIPPKTTRSYYEGLRDEEFYSVRKLRASKSEGARLSVGSAGEYGYSRKEGVEEKKRFGQKMLPTGAQTQTDKGEMGVMESQKTGEASTDTAGQGQGQVQPVQSELDFDDGGEPLSFFDPKHVKPEYFSQLQKSKNIVVGHPREILKKYFDYADDDELPAELANDNSPKAFILPKKFWKDGGLEDAATPSQAAKRAASRKALAEKKRQEEEERRRKEMEHFIPDKDLVDELRREDEKPDGYIPRQPKHYGVEILGRRSFSKHGMMGSNLNDASPGDLEHWELKPLDVDAGGQLKRDFSDRRWKISEVTGTPVKVAAKEKPIPDKRRPWYHDNWAEKTDPRLVTENPEYSKDYGYKAGADKGSGRQQGRSDGRGPRRPRGSGDERYSDYSDWSDGSGYSCTCGDSDSGSPSGSTDDEESSESGGKGKKKQPRKKGKKKEKEKSKEKKEPVTTKDTATDAISDGTPPWAPDAWKTPEGFKAWFFNHKKGEKGSISTPDLPLVHDSRDRDWFRAYYLLRKAQDEHGVDELKELLGDSDSARKFLEELEKEWEERGEDLMDRLPRNIPSAREYPLHKQPTNFNYYKSYPLYPTISSERYFEWFKDVDRLEDPRKRKKRARPAGFSKSAGHINWDDPKEAAKWYSYGYRRPDSRPKPERPDYDTKDYVYDNARSIMLMPARKAVPKYIDDRKGTSHYLEPSGLMQKYVLRDDFGEMPEYLMGINEELGRPAMPDFDKFYRPHRCKFLHGHIHCKMCMRAHPTVKHKKMNWNCEMGPCDFEDALAYRESRQPYVDNKNHGYSVRTEPDYREHFDLNNFIQRLAQSNPTGCCDSAFDQGRQQNFYEYVVDNSRNCYSNPVYV